MNIVKLKQDSPTAILFTHYGDNWIRGSERCLLDLLTHLDRDMFTPIVWCNSQVMQNEVTALGVVVYRTDFSLLLGWSSPRFQLPAFISQVRRGIQLVSKHKIQLLHANSGAPNQWLNLVARICRIPLLAHLHSRYPLRDRITLGLHQVPMAVGVSQDAIDSLRQDGISPERNCVIANGIDTDRLNKKKDIDLRQQLNLSPNDYLIATTGSLIKRKGADLIIDAVFELISQGITAHLVIIGKGPEHHTLRRQSQRLGINKQVHLLGEQTNVVGLIRGSADIFVSGSREEVFGLVLAEAGLASLAVIAPTVGGIPSVVVHNQTGLLIPKEDSTAMAKAMLKLYREPELRKRMGLRGREHVLKNFTIERNVQQFEQLYNTLLHDPAMQTGWFTHWQIWNPLIRSIKRVFSLTFNRHFKDSNYE